MSALSTGRSSFHCLIFFSFLCFIFINFVLDFCTLETFLAPVASWCAAIVVEVAWIRTEITCWNETNNRSYSRPKIFGLDGREVFLCLVES